MPGPQRAEDAQYEIVEGNAIIIDSAGTEVVTLNELGTLVWQRLDGGHDVGSLAGELGARFDDVPAQQLEDDVRTFLKDLQDSKLIVGRF